MLRIITTFALMAPNFALATSITDVSRLTQVIRKSVSADRQKSKTPPTSCTHFGGEWAGTCTDSEGITREANLTINQNGCEFVDEDGKNAIELATLRGFVNTSPRNDVTNGGVSVNWNADKTALKIFGGGLYQQLGENTALRITIDGDVGMQDGKLVSTSVSDSKGILLGQEKTFHYAQTCTYDRK